MGAFATNQVAHISHNMGIFLRIECSNLGVKRDTHFNALLIISHIIRYNVFISIYSKLKPLSISTQLFN